MHYRHAPYGLEKIAGVEEFLRLWPEEVIHKLEDNQFSYVAGQENPRGETEIFLPTYPFGA
jgi:hypothetical protein